MDTHSTAATMPSYLIDMVRRQPPLDCQVMPGTVPVVSFGDVRTARVATLGINPSSGEFADKGGFLTEGKRRLATLASLGADDPASLSDEQVATAVRECFRYFDVNPYNKWFKPLDMILTLGLGASYYDGSACHLDLVQWATDPVWSKLDKQQRRVLLDDGAQHLQAQLESEHVDLVVVNGSEVWQQLDATGLATVEDVAELAFGSGSQSTILRVGTGCGVTFVGWTLNVQGSFGVRNEDKRALANWLESVAPRPATPAAPVGAMPRTKVTSKSEFTALLRQWFAESDAETIGTIGNYGGSPHVILDLDDHVVVLNADTKRSAVDTYLASVEARGAESTWRVLLNSRGVANKVDFATSGPATPGWYCYLKEPMNEEGAI
jgi:hypothetical protein